MVPPAKATPAQMEEGRKRAAKALKQAQATKTYEQFGLLAEKISEDDYRVMMGDHRAVERAKLPPAILLALQGMRPGDISGIIQVEQTLTIVRLNAHTPGGVRKFDEAKDELRKQLDQDQDRATSIGAGKEAANQSQDRGTLSRRRTVRRKCRLGENINSRDLCGTGGHSSPSVGAG